MPVQKQAGSGFESFTFYLSLLLLAAAIGSFFYFQYSVGQRIAKRDELKIEASKSKTAEQKNLENRIMTVRQQLRDFSAALNERKLGTMFFSKFETLVFPEVFSFARMDPCRNSTSSFRNGFLERINPK
ncbi:MAG: hypothetical protein MUD10_01490, partial [Candidatus Pacebacteria bacterium]|nr:hypothetical protein [Candidatus Paceibacterota bacterium]